MQKKLQLFFFGLLMALFCLTVKVEAAEFGIPDNNGQFTLEKNTTINDNYLVAAGQAEINGTIKGDLIVAGGTVEINGPIEGNLFVGAGQVKVNSQIKQDVFVGAGQVEFTENSQVFGDMFIGSGMAELNGTIDGKLYSGNGDLTINGIIKKDTTLDCGTITLKPQAVLMGNLKYTAEEEMNTQNGSQVKGTITKNIATEKTIDKSSKNDLGFLSAILPGAGFIATITGSFISLLSTLLVGIISLMIFPKYFEKVSNTIKEKFWPSLGWGILIWIAVPIVMIISIMIIIGIPLSIILFGLYLLAIYFSRIFVGLYLGRLISHDSWKHIWSMTIGVLIIALIGLIPVIGWLINLAVVFIGFGSIIQTKYCEAHSLKK